MTEEALIYMPGSTAGTTMWRIESMQMRGWGGYEQPTKVEFSEVVTLLTGDSGTGKSTLLDAYIALMMDSGVAFNSASNSATTGRARSAEQRNLLSYLRGKLDNTVEVDGVVQQQMLRGGKLPVWGALAITFVDDRGRRYTVAKLYYVPASATRDSEITKKLCLIDGAIDLGSEDLDDLAVRKFEKSAMESRFSGLKIYGSFEEFRTAMCTRLGIGRNGDGRLALRLLARILAGEEVTTIDALYKTMVLEKPTTFKAAQAAVDHFQNLEDSWEAMDTEVRKAAMLARVPELGEVRERAREQARMLDRFGVAREGDTPFRLWQLVTEDNLLESAEVEASLTIGDAETKKRQADSERHAVRTRLAEVEASLVENEANKALAALETEIQALTTSRHDIERTRVLFDDATQGLGLVLGDRDDFDMAQAAASEFLSSYENTRADIERRHREVTAAQYEPLQEKATLVREQESLAHREGRMDERLHQARVAIASASGIPVEELPFVGELIDVPSSQKRWRKAIETTLHGAARTMLVDNTRLDAMSAAIDGIALPVRVNFQGVELSPFTEPATDPAFVSGKLVYKESPFTNWVVDRVAQDHTDARCVESTDELRGHGLRVTPSGQTRRGRGGAHGNYTGGNVIGFSKEERLAEIVERLDEIETVLIQLDVEETMLSNERHLLDGLRRGHDAVAAATWKHIDLEGCDQAITTARDSRAALLASDNSLKLLQTERERLVEQEAQLNRDYYTNDNIIVMTTPRRDALATRKDATRRKIERVEEAQTVELTDDQITYLDREYALVATPGDLDGLSVGVDRLKHQLSLHTKGANEKAAEATRALESIFHGFLQEWSQPDLTESIENYDTFRGILDTIHAKGLNERKAEWTRRLTTWSGEDLVPLAGAFSLALSDIQSRLDPVNDILATLDYGERRERLKIMFREVPRENVTRFKRLLGQLSRGVPADLSEEQVQQWFKRLRDFMAYLRLDAQGKSSSERDSLLDVRQHIEVWADVLDPETMVRRTELKHFAGKSGGEMQEVVAFVIGAALRFQLGDDEGNQRPRFAPVFMDEGFVKSDGKHTGRGIEAWRKLGFQLIIGAPIDKFTAMEPFADKVLHVTKDSTYRSHINVVQPAAGTSNLVDA